MYCEHHTQKASGWVSSTILQPNFVDILDELRIENCDLQVRDIFIVSLTGRSDIQTIIFRINFNRSHQIFISIDLCLHRCVCAVNIQLNVITDTDVYSCKI